MCGKTEEWFRLRNEATLSGAIAFVPWILQESYKEGAMANPADIVIHRGEGAVVFSDASGFTALTERLAVKSNGAELLSQCLTSFFTPLIDIILSYRGDVIKFSGDALTIYFPAVDDTKHPRYRPVVPPHGTYGLPDLGPMPTAVLRSCACCIEIHKRLHMFDTGVDGVCLCLHIGVGCGSVTILQVGGVVPPETKTPRYEYVVAGPPLEQISVAEPLAKNGETCVSPQAWRYVEDSVTEGRKLDDEHADFHILLQLEESKYTYPTVRNAAVERDAREENYKFQLSELPALRMYIPSAVFKQIEGGTLTYVNEMRNIATIFISGSGVDVSTDEGSKVAQDLMSGVQLCCYAHEGTLNKYLVDDKGMLFLLVYGLPPMVHTDDPSRAVLACLDIIEVFRRLGLVGRCGVTTGRNYCGVVGSAKRMEYTVLGDTVNLAARLMANASPLSILVDEATMQLSGRDVGYKSLTPIKVKGKSALIPIFEPIPLGPKESIGLRLDNSIGFPWKPVSSFLGGKSKLTEVAAWEDMLTVQRLLQEAKNSKGNSNLLFAGGGVMVIGGDIGMGKTELCEYTVSEAFKRFNFVPIFGTAGSRPGQKFRPIHELLRSLVMSFRHLDSTLPAQEHLALTTLTRLLGETGDLADFARDLSQDLGLPGDVAAVAKRHGSEGGQFLSQYCSRGSALSVKLLRQLTRERPVTCVLSLRSGSNVFTSTERSEDEQTFWNIASAICDLAKEQLQHPLLVVLVVKGTLDDVPSAIRTMVPSDGYLRLSPLKDDAILDYIGKHAQVVPSKVPENLHRFVAKITQGNALFIRETIDQLMSSGHIRIVKDGNMFSTTDLESVNIADWANTAMVGGTICLLESLDPLQAAVVKMATVFRGAFTVADLAASSCSRWAGATYFDAFRVFSSLSLLVNRGIIDSADSDNEVDKGFLDNAEMIECFRLSNVLVRKVGNSMVLEAQKKAVKRQALMERVLAKDLPYKMVELRRKKAIQHIPWYYQIDQAEGKARAP
jgi:class 3 adenylate cyclase